jgi:ACR3 family arsenite efflux pump ArsB
MIPITVLIIIFAFIGLYMIGLLFSLAVFIEFIKDKKVKPAIVPFLIVMMYILLGLRLLF